ncbi:MAG TPA: CocE/NonD family hydrolase, partial [Gemmatimonadales bacterium]|nr:CocE/NonD family hydrolase [Gemmatimonadales bacterium]
LPILLVRTPFNAEREFRGAEPPAGYRELARDGYIFVAEDIRGRGASEGTFVTLRPLAAPGEAHGVDESTDAYDTIDWLVRHLPGNNGKVGVLGHSYRGWLAAMAAVHPHPALKAVSPEAPMTDVWLGDDFFHQGAFRQTQGVLYSGYIEGSGVSLPDGDAYDVYLRYPTLDSLARAAGVDTLPSWRGFRAHPAYDAWWTARSLRPLLARPAVPALWVGGAWDAEDLYGPQEGYRLAERLDPEGRNHFVLGPWAHGSWLRGAGDSLGPLPLGSATSEWFRAHVQRPWFAYWLHGTGDGGFPEAWVYETGADRWRTFDRWPAPGARALSLYLHPDGVLRFDPPAAGGAASTAWRSDPADPVPYVRRPDDGSGWDTWLAADQRFLAGREDVRSWVSAPLDADLTIAGDVVARLFASTTGTDADWVVKLIDVYPDQVSGAPALGGYQLMVNADILRGRYWRGFDHATPIPAGQVTPFTVDLHQQLYRFRAGHRVMVQVQSSWFPLYDRNPQTFVPDIFAARPGDFRAAEHRVWHTPRYPSRVEVRVLD